MAFMRRVRRQKFAQGTAEALAVPVRPSPTDIFERAGGGETPSEVSLQSPISQPSASPERRIINELPPGMPKMPVEPPEYARNERRASSLDEEEYVKSKRRLRNVFKKRSYYQDAIDNDYANHNRRTRTPMDSVPTISGDSSVTQVDNGNGNGNNSGSRTRNSGSRERSGTRTRTTTVSHPPSSSMSLNYDGEYECQAIPTESPNSRLRLCDLNTKGKYVNIAEEVTQVTRIHDNYVSFIVPHGWIATRTSWGFYLSSNKCIGFVLTSSSREASSILCDTRRLCVFSKVHVLSSPIFESKHTAVVNYAAHDIKGRGIALHNKGFKSGAVVFALCAPQYQAENLRKVERRLASTAVVLAVPPKELHQNIDDGYGNGYADNTLAASRPTGLQAYYQPIARLSTGTNCVMQ